MRQFYVHRDSLLDRQELPRVKRARAGYVAVTVCGGADLPPGARGAGFRLARLNVSMWQLAEEQAALVDEVRALRRALGKVKR